jgi:homogentisate 1,2-dioxygenase
MDMKKIYHLHDVRKMKKYNNRKIQVEKGNFTPLIYSTFGGWGPQTTRYHERLAEKLSQKRGEDHAAIMFYMRTRIRFSILRSTLIAVRGERGRCQRCYIL